MSLGLAPWSQIGEDADAPNTPYNGVYSTDPWDTLHLYASGGHYQFPGLVQVKTSRDRGFDERKPTGKAGGAVTLHGTILAKVEITCIVWTPGQWSALQSLIDVICPRPREALTAAELKKAGEGRTFTAIHPKLQALNVCVVAFTSCSSVDDGPQPGSKQITCKAIEYIKPQPSSKKAISKLAPPEGTVKKFQNKQLQSKQPANAPKSKPSEDKLFSGPG